MGGGRNLSKGNFCKCKLLVSRSFHAIIARTRQVSHILSARIVGASYQQRDLQATPVISISTNYRLALSRKVMKIEFESL